MATSNASIIYDDTWLTVSSASYPAEGTAGEAGVENRRFSKIQYRDSVLRGSSFDDSEVQTRSGTQAYSTSRSETSISRGTISKMKIAFTGGGTGGHFYPIIAIVEYIEDIAQEQRLVSPELYYLGPRPFDSASLLEHDIVHLKSAAGKMRQYRSVLNVFDVFKTGWGIFRALFQLFSLFPDVIFSTGGYAAFPTLYAARILRIPVIIYDSDATPGKVSLWSAKFARWIAVAHPHAAAGFPKSAQSKIALVGHPIRKEIETTAKEGGHEFLKLDASVPTVFFMGGSQGAHVINEAVLDSVVSLVEKYNVVHQTGIANLDDVRSIANVALRDSRYADRYRSFGLLNALALRMTASIATLIVARAGSGTIYEVASWKLPCILVPLPIDVSRDQTENAFSYARSGAAVVIEQRNLTPHVLIAEIDRLMQNQELRNQMSDAASTFARPEAARKIAQIILETALEHEPV